jgi:hypothetical protein
MSSEDESEEDRAFIRALKTAWHDLPEEDQAHLLMQQRVIAFLVSNADERFTSDQVANAIDYPNHDEVLATLRLYAPCEDIVVPVTEMEDGTFVYVTGSASIPKTEIVELLALANGSGTDLPDCDTPVRWDTRRRVVLLRR